MAREHLGEISVPSGTLTLFDPGHIGMFEDKEIEAVPSLSIAGMPRDRALRIEGERVGSGPWAASWDHVVVVLSDGPVAQTEDVGDALVDFARLLLIDEDVAGRWVHSRCLDGKADFVLWGEDARAMAEELGAPALTETLFGWRDLEEGEAMRDAIDAEALKEQRSFAVTTEYRPHSHHFQVLEAMEGTKTASGSVEIEGARVCVFATTWLDGLFPVFLDVAADGTPVQVRIQLRTEASEDAMAHG